MCPETVHHSDFRGAYHRRSRHCQGEGAWNLREFPGPSLYISRVNGVGGSNFHVRISGGPVRHSWNCADLWKWRTWKSPPAIQQEGSSCSGTRSRAPAASQRCRPPSWRHRHQASGAPHGQDARPRRPAHHGPARGASGRAGSGVAPRRGRGPQSRARWQGTSRTGPERAVGDVCGADVYQHGSILHSG